MAAVHGLAQALSLPEERLLDLAGYGQPAASLQEAAVRFAARWNPASSCPPRNTRPCRSLCISWRSEETSGKRSGVVLRRESTPDLIALPMKLTASCAALYDRVLVAIPA